MINFNSRSINSAIDTSKMLNELYKICDDYKSENLPFNHIPSKIVIKATLDRIFNQWDSFIEKLEKDNHLIAPIFKEYSYKYTWMKDEELKEVYNRLS